MVLTSSAVAAVQRAPDPLVTASKKKCPPPLIAACLSFAAFRFQNVVVREMNKMSYLRCERPRSACERTHTSVCEIMYMYTAVYAMIWTWTHHHHLRESTTVAEARRATGFDSTACWFDSSVLLVMHAVETEWHARTPHVEREEIDTTTCYTARPTVPSTTSVVVLIRIILRLSPSHLKSITHARTTAA